MAPIDDRRRFKAAIEQSAPGSSKGYEGREPSDPPTNILDIHLEKTAKRASHVKTIIGVVIAIVLGGVALVTWLRDRPSKGDLAAAESRAIAIAEAKNSQIFELTKDVVRLQTMVIDMKTEQDRRWNNLDTILQRQFGSDTNNPAPPTYGSRAHQQGRP